MKLKILFAALTVCGTMGAQTDDPVVMVVNGEPVTRSEFEYSFNKNNSEGVIDKKSVDEYVDLFINYKLKVAAALDAKYDTLTSFKTEFAQYRDQQVRPAFVTDADMEAEAHKIYNKTVEQIGPDGMIRVAHILIRAQQQAPQSEWDAAKVRIDSIYNALKNGADFEELAKRVSQDPGSARQGGLLPFVQRGQLVKEFENAAYALQPGEMSGVIQSPYGYHIILLKDRKPLDPFDSVKDIIIQRLEQQGIRERIAEQRIQKIVDQSGGAMTREDIITRKTDSLARVDSETKYLRSVIVRSGTRVPRMRLDWLPISRLTKRIMPGRNLGSRVWPIM